MSVYLDWNATSPPHEAVLAAMQAAGSRAWANPASVHGPGRRARDEVESARELLAAVLGVEARSVVFTGGGTEANHLALSGAGCIVTSRLEHPSVVREAERLAVAGAPVLFVDVTASGVVLPAAIDEALRRAPADFRPAGSGEAARTVVAVMAANHETGVIQPIEDIAQVVHAHGAWLHVDAVQSLGRAPALESLAAADSIAVAAHKLRGPKGIGALAFRAGRRVQARGLGGSQERGLRAGTVDAVACAGFAAALSRLSASVAGYAASQELRDRFERILRRSARSTVRVHGAEATRLPHVTNFSLAGQRGDELVAALDLLGVHVSSGSACAAGTAEPSPVISAMAGPEAARSAVRVSFGEDSTEGDLQALVLGLHRLGLLTSPSSFP